MTATVITPDVRAKAAGLARRGVLRVLRLIEPAAAPVSLYTLSDAAEELNRVAELLESIEDHDNQGGQP